MRVKLFLTAAAILLCFTAVFAQNNPLLKYLPADASMVMSFNPVKLANKIPGETFRQSSMYREMMKNDGGELNAFLSDPSISGVDFSSDLVLTISNDTTSRKPGVNLSIFGALKNEALFALTIKKIMKEEQDSLLVYGTNHILLPGNAGTALAWNNEIFVITTGNKSGMRQDLVNSFSDTTDQRDYELRMTEYVDKQKKALRNYCFELLTPKPGNMFGANPYLTQVMADNGDVKIWSNGSGLGSYMKEMPPQLAGIFSNLKKPGGTNKTTVINFENGKISGLTHNYISDEMAAIYKKYPAAALNTDLVRRLPAEGKLMALMLNSMDPGMVNELLQQTGINGMLDSLKEKIPFDLKLLHGVFKSNMMLAIINMPVQKQRGADNENRPGVLGAMGLIVAVPIADKAKFDELRIAAASIIDSMKGSKPDEDRPKKEMPVVKFNDQLLVLSMSEEVATAYLNNPGTGTLPAWLPEFTNYPMVINVNLKEILNSFLGMKKDPESEPDPQMQKLTELFDQLIITSGNYDNGSLLSKMEFRFGNPNENALKQLFDLAEMAASQKRTVTIEDVRQEEMKEPPPPPPPPPMEGTKRDDEPKRFTPPVIMIDEEVEKPTPPKKNTKKPAPVKKTNG